MSGFSRPRAAPVLLAAAAACVTVPVGTTYEAAAPPDAPACVSRTLDEMGFRLVEGDAPDVVRGWRPEGEEPHALDVWVTARYRPGEGAGATAENAPDDTSGNGLLTVVPASVEHDPGAHAAPRPPDEEAVADPALEARRVAAAVLASCGLAESPPAPAR